MSTTLAVNDINQALRTAVTYQSQGKNVEIKGKAKNKIVTYYVIIGE